MTDKVERNRSSKSRSLTATLAIAFVALSLVVLLVASSLQLYAYFLAQQAVVAGEQRLIAQQAVSSVASFIQEKFSVLEAAVKLGDSAYISPQQQQRVLENLLGLQPAFRNLVLFDSQDQAVVKTSRVSKAVSEQIINRVVGTDLLAQTGQGDRYIGPVYIDEVTYEPLMVMAVPVQDIFGDFQGTLVAEVNLKFMWDLVDRLEVGETGVAYVVDRQGNLLAYRDVTRVLAGENLSHLAEVAEFVAREDTFSELEEEGVPVSTGINGTRVLATYVPLGTPDWAVVTELPMVEAYEKVIRNIVIAGGIILIVALLAAVAGAFLARRLASPILDLSITATKIAEGDIDLQAAAEGPTEVARLGQAFNTMTGHLRNLIDSLEDRVYERTRALETSADISSRLISIRDLDELLRYVVSHLQTEFNFYHAHIYLIEGETGDLVMVEGSGEVGRQLKEKGHRLEAGQGIVGTVASTNEAFLSNNVDNLLNFVRNPLLPETRSELAVPLRKGNDVLGVLDIQSEQLNHFSQSDLSLMQAIANQTAIAVDNARLLSQTQVALNKVEQLNRQLTGEVWEQAIEAQPATGYRFIKGISLPITRQADMWLPPMQQAAIKKQVVKEIHPGNGEPARSELAVPLILRGQVIGSLGLKREEAADWNEDELTAVESVANQITLALENARLSEEQAKTIVQLKDVDRLKSEFLTSMSHELRTPLNSIIGFADVILQGIDGELPDMAVNDVRLIHNSGQHLLALINDILDLSKIEAGKLELVPEPLDVGHAFKEVLSASGSLVKDKPVKILVEAETTLPPIYADKLRFNQIMLNLVSNAVKFTEEGSVTLRAEIQEQTPDRMLISVIDTGIGIPADKVETVFDRFRQADSSTTRKYGGTGLGLPICKQLVEMHGGEIGLTSAVDQGSRFYFTIPLADESVMIEV